MFVCCCPPQVNGAIVERLEDDFSGAVGQSVVSYDPGVRNVTYVSDVEGQWDYFCNFVEHSKGLNFTNQAEPHLRREAEMLELELEDGWHFVYGGDACDKGSGTLRFLEAIVSLKKKVPDRVHILLGNGDFNRLRWTGDLIASDLVPPKEVNVALWQQSGPFEFTDKDFEARREELAHIQGKFAHEIVDADVMKSYMEGIKAGGWLLEYLMQAQGCVMLGETLFVDGQVIVLTADEATQNQSPEDKERAGLEMEDWCTRLNGWVRTRLDELESKSAWEILPDQMPKRPSPDEAGG